MARTLNWQLLWRICHNSFVFAGANILQRALEVALRAVKIGILLIFVGMQVGVNEFDETIQVLGSDSLVLLVEIVDIAVENFHKELDGDSGVHTGVGHTEGALEALEDSFAVAVELKKRRGQLKDIKALKKETKLASLGSSSSR